MRLPGDAVPGRVLVEAAVHEQVFAPEQRGLGWIRVRGIAFEHASNGFPVPQRGLVSTSRGHHWTIENCSIRWANSVGIDCGNECWHASRPSEPYSGHTIRGCRVSDCGICGIAGIVSKNLTVEDCLIERCGWQDAEYMYESAGAKFHHTVGLVFQRNVIRDLMHAPGLWLDCGNRDCRVTRNVFCGIDTRGGAIHVEATRDANTYDHNVFADVRTVTGLDGHAEGGHGVWLEGSDQQTVAHNLFLNLMGTGVHTGAVSRRIVDGKGETVRANRLLNNLFIHCERAAIDLLKSGNECEGNAYASMPGGYLRLSSPEPVEWFDLSGWQQYLGKDLQGQTAKAEGSLDCRGLTLALKYEKSLIPVPPVPGLEEDFLGHPISGDRVPGPFQMKGKTLRAKIDPRK